MFAPPALVLFTGAPPDLALLPLIDCAAEIPGAVLDLQPRPATRSHLLRPAMCRLDVSEKKDDASNKDLEYSISRNSNAGHTTHIDNIQVSALSSATLWDCHWHITNMDDSEPLGRNYGLCIETIDCCSYMQLGLEHHGDDEVCHAISHEAHWCAKLMKSNTIAVMVSVCQFYGPEKQCNRSIP